MTDLLILASLLDGPKHGYDLKKQAGLIFNRDLHNNLVYPLLHRFEKNGWVRSKETPGGRGQTRFQYALTAAGRRELLRQVSEFSESEGPSAEAFYLRVGLFQALPNETRERILTVREKHLRASLDHMRRLETELELGLYGGEVVRHLARTFRFELAWIKRLRKAEAGERGAASRRLRRSDNV